VTHLNDENELLESAVNKKDQEIAKLRQNNQLLLSNVDALELELEKHKARLTSGGKLYENEKNDLRLKLTQMEGKLQDY
jgi:regulator of replication initiation timing